jgi:hypothetical protein
MSQHSIIYCPQLREVLMDDARKNLELIRSVIAFDAIVVHIEVNR